MYNVEECVKVQMGVTSARDFGINTCTVRQLIWSDTSGRNESCTFERFKPVRISDDRLILAENTIVNSKSANTATVP